MIVYVFLLNINFIMTKNIYFVRHGETEWNKLELSQGSKN